MGTLADHLKDSMQDGALSGSDKGLWDQFVDELGTKDLESALQAIKLSEKLSDHVVEQTWNLISEPRRVCRRLIYVSHAAMAA